MSQKLFKKGDLVCLKHDRKQRLTFLKYVNDHFALCLEGIEKECKIAVATLDFYTGRSGGISKDKILV